MSHFIKKVKTLKIASLTSMFLSDFQGSPVEVILCYFKMLRGIGIELF